jgi:hypothetical protein
MKHENHGKHQLESQRDREQQEESV